MQDQSRPLIRSIIIDIVLNAAIPTILYYIAKHYFDTSELNALIVSTIFPIAKSIFDFAKKRELDPIAIIVLLGIIVSIAALFVGGSPKLLLIRESFVTGMLGIVCLISLLFPKPFMYYFSEYFVAGSDVEKKKQFRKSYEIREVRAFHQLNTIVWGVAFSAEFGLRILMVYTLSTLTVLTVSPIITGAVTIGVIFWTFEAAKRMREKRKVK